MATRKSRAVAIVAMLAISVIASCARTDPEKQLRAAVSEMEAAVKAKDVTKFTSYLSDDFSRAGASGMTKLEAKRTLAALLLTNPNVYMNVTIKRVDINREQANVSMVVVASGGNGIIPERAQSWDFATEWRFESGHWRVSHAQWVEVPGLL